MNKKIYYFTLLLLIGFCFSFASCLKSDDGVKIDEEWKALNERRFAEASVTHINELSSQSGNGKVRWKKSEVITDSDKSLRITTGGRPEFTDTVRVRYEGWYLDRNGKKIIFDSTENPNSFSSPQEIDRFPNKIPFKCGINETPISGGYSSGIIDGWRAILQDMRVGDEREVVIPQELAYGANTQTDSEKGIVTIPAYTTLWFNIKLLEIIPMAPLKN